MKRRKNPGPLNGGFFDIRFNRLRLIDVPDPDEEIDLDGIQEIRNLRHPPKLFEESGE